MTTPKAELITFPNEIFCEVAQHLDHRNDMHTLLDLALVNQFWRHQSQRIIFSEIGRSDHNWPGAMGSNDVANVYFAFLEAVVGAPTRLGPYVKRYFFLGNTFKTAWIDELWVLTQRALPHMVNLKRLTFLPPRPVGYPYSRILLHCSFQLESLFWVTSEDTADDLSTFLLTQSALRHLDVKLHGNRGTQALAWKSDSLRLESIVCHSDGLPALAGQTNLTSLHIYGHSGVGPTPHSDAALVLQDIKHLKVPASLIARGFPGMVLPNVVILEIDKWSLDDVAEHLANFPVLRVFVHPMEKSTPSDTDAQMELGLEIADCFHQCPRLERVVSPNIVNRFFTTFTVTYTEDRDEVMVHAKVTCREYDVNEPWWVAYNLDV